MIGPSSCPLLEDDTQLTAGPSGPIEEGLVKIGKGKGQHAEQVYTADETKSFGSHAQGNDHFSCWENCPCNWGKENLTLLTCATGFCTLRSDAIRWWIANIWNQLQTSHTNDLSVLKCQGWFKKMIHCSTFMAQNWTHLNLKQLLVRIALLFGNASVYPDWATLNNYVQVNSNFSSQLHYRNSALGPYTSELEITDIYTPIETECKGRTVSCSMYNWCQKDKLK